LEIYGNGGVINVYFVFKSGNFNFTYTRMFTFARIAARGY